MEEKLKYCIGCKIRKSLSEFHIDKSRRDGYREKCKTCRSRRVVPLERDLEFKICTECNKSKRISEFWKNGKHRRSKCKVCLGRYNEQYYDKYSTIIIQGARVYSEIRGATEISEWARLAACERTGRWRAFQFGCKYEKVDLAKILTRDGMKCHICSETILDILDLEFDHVISLSRGGSHTYENIKPSHARCNWGKH
jgi:5-methylcytosine-specific restriction endonuclease McrA